MRIWSECVSAMAASNRFIRLPRLAVDHPAVWRELNERQVCRHDGSVLSGDNGV